MKKELIKIRKFNKEEYQIYLCTAEYIGERGVLGFEIETYIEVVAPKNDFGYEDIILFNSHGRAYSLNRYHANWIMCELEKINKRLLNKYVGL